MKRVVVAGLGDTGVLTAIKLARHGMRVTGVSAKPGLVSGQELGWRLARPDEWARHNWIPFGRFRGLDGVATLHGVTAGVDLESRCVHVELADGSVQQLPYDVLVIATGVANGFWRKPILQDAAGVDADLRDPHDRLAAAASVIIVGGGAAAVSSAAQIATGWPGKRVGLYYPGERALIGHHPRTWDTVRRKLIDLGVGLHPGHRAELGRSAGADELGSGTVQWSTGQPPAAAEAVLWAIGRVTPNTGWLPAELLDDHGFVRVTPTLQAPGRPEVFAIGDVAATDPLRSSARNRADGLLAANVHATFTGKALRNYRAPARRWGSVLGIQPDGLQVFAANGRAFRFPAWSFERVLMPWVVGRGIYGGIRPAVNPAASRR